VPGSGRALAADGVVWIDGEVLLLRRDHPHHGGAWVLPGGTVDPGERAAEACVREVREEVGVDVEFVEFVGLWDAPDRDPRGNVSAASRCRPIGEADPRAREEAHEVDTFPPGDLPEVGFDYRGIVEDAEGTFESRGRGVRS
jgi:8-oxo-dGTP diphosphatase